jgi:hypothetical protein
MSVPKFDIPRITTLVQEMAKDLINGKGYNSKYDYVKESLPEMYDLLVEDPEKSLPNIMYMLDMAGKVKDKESQEFQSKKVGLFLAQKFVYPNLDMTKETIPDIGEGSSSGSI